MTKRDHFLDVERNEGGWLNGSVQRILPFLSSKEEFKGCEKSATKYPVLCTLCKSGAHVNPSADALLTHIRLEPLNPTVAYLFCTTID